MNESLLLPNSRITVIFCVAGVRPGSRAPFVPAKGAKTIDAPSSLITLDERKAWEGEPTRYAQTRLTGSLERPSRGLAAGVGPWETNISGIQLKGRGTIHSPYDPEEASQAGG